MVYNFIHRSGVPGSLYPADGQVRLSVEMLRTDVKVTAPTDPLVVSTTAATDDLLRRFERIAAAEGRADLIKEGPWEVLVYNYDHTRTAFRYALDVDAKDQEFAELGLRGDSGRLRGLCLVEDSPYSRGVNGISRKGRGKDPEYGKDAKNPEIPVDHVRIWISGDTKKDLTLPVDVFLTNWAGPAVTERVYSDAPKRRNKRKSKGGKGRKSETPPPPKAQQTPLGMLKPAAQAGPSAPVARPSTLPERPFTLDVRPNLPDLVRVSLPSKPQIAVGEVLMPTIKHELEATMAESKRPGPSYTAPTSCKGKEKAVELVVEDSAEDLKCKSEQVSVVVVKVEETTDLVYMRATTEEDEDTVLAVPISNGDTPVTGAELAEPESPGKRKRAEDNADASSIPNGGELECKVEDMADETSTDHHKVSVDHRRFQSEPLAPEPDESQPGLADAPSRPAKRLRIEESAISPDSASDGHDMSRDASLGVRTRSSTMLGSFVGSVAAMWATLSRSGPGEE